MATAASLFASVDGLRHAPQHNGKAHNLLHMRQEPTGPDELVSDSPSLPPVSSVIPNITVTIVPMPGNTSLVPILGQSSLPNDTIPVFPTSTIQEPIVTLCPGQPTESRVFTILPPLPPLSSIPGSVPTINATALLPNGSSTVFSSGLTTTPIPLPSPISQPANDPENAHIAIDDSGCQTLFAPTVKAVCSTTVSPIGIPEVVVTDCDQYITFSSETKICPTVSMPTVIPTPRPTILEGPDPAVATSSPPIFTNPLLSSGAPVAEPVIGKHKRQDSGAAVVTPAGPAILPLPSYPESSGPPGTYYAAPWYDVARGGVPPSVQAVECDGSHVGCTTFSERWSITSLLRTVTETRPISYSGPVVVADGTRTYTTTISVATVTTTTRVTYSASVIRRRLLLADADDVASASAPPQTVQATLTLTATEFEGVATSGAAAGDGAPQQEEAAPQGRVRTVQLVDVGA
ncbi:uncharacterized protein HMPREF1541_09413 [Cyphellophora europaea CBS 101466]|uniref:Uncharacterized protein n=1 Tax=Cyphellophora europaea (strain CBS 101466) TaxID=1220924 RepID=W2SA24_CYPE1|nr:uncharacterized protein HMPREF1541_09413 [Cyphellophora europaea CBS 101466]ETN45581.1 hypothetical protein HMPREF1541_09413 [Cyphellophora europaea CBS 101466]